MAGCDFEHGAQVLETRCDGGVGDLPSTAATTPVVVAKCGHALGSERFSHGGQFGTVFAAVQAVGDDDAGKTRAGRQVERTDDGIIAAIDFDFLNGHRVLAPSAWAARWLA